MSVQHKVTAKQFGKIVPKITGAVHGQIVLAMQEAAVYGQMEIQNTINATKPVPAATGTYRSSWRVEKLQTGAILGNSTLQSYFVEMGRRPGKAPPIEAISEWVRIKRLTGGGTKPKTRRSRKAKARNQQYGLARAIQLKIAREGTKARKPLERTKPKINAFLAREIQRQVDLTKAPR